MKRTIGEWSVGVALILAVMLPAGLYLIGPAAPAVSAQNFNPVACLDHVNISTASAATAELVALTANQRISVCGMVLTGGGATTFKLVRGTGTNCGTGTADVTAAFELGDNTSVPIGGAVGAWETLAAGQALCGTNSAAVQVSGIVFYRKG